MLGSPAGTVKRASPARNSVGFAGHNTIYPPDVYSTCMTKERGRSPLDFGIRVGAVVERDGSILLVRHQKPDREPYWVLPGGRLEPGETIPECAERELAEEALLRVRFHGILYLSEFIRHGRHTVDVTVRAMAEKGAEAALGSDPEFEEESEYTLIDLRWVGLDEIDSVELLPTWIKDRIILDADRGWPETELYLGGGRD